MPKLLKVPRRVKVGLWFTVLRKYADVKCVDCPFRGANHHNNFATRAEWNGHSMKRPRCHACVRRRQAAADAAWRLALRVYGAERRARKKKKTFHVPRNAKRNLMLVTRHRAINRRLRGVLRAQK